MSLSFLFLNVPVHFFQLHQYPGYEPKELTPLPHDVTPVEILTKVANAQPSLRKMVHKLLHQS